MIGAMSCMLLPADQVDGYALFLGVLVLLASVAMRTVRSAAAFAFEAAAWRKVEHALWIKASAMSSWTRTCITAVVMMSVVQMGQHSREKLVAFTLSLSFALSLSSASLFDEKNYETARHPAPEPPTQVPSENLFEFCNVRIPLSVCVNFTLFVWVAFELVGRS